MKKLTLLLTICCVSIMAYAAGGNITYVLNGGVTNDHGWQDKQDMYEGLNASWNTYSGTNTTWTSLAQLIQENGDALAAVPKGIPTTPGAAMTLDFMNDATVKSEWQWLFDYMDAVCEAQGAALATSGDAFLRYNLSAFFLNSIRTTYPVSADYAAAGLPAAFMPAWQHGFAGPATYDGETDVVLPTPYKEGESFAGWYDNEALTGVRVTVIPAGTEGDITLYAKFGEYIPACSEVWEMAAGETTKTAGTVTYIDGNNVYMQDVTAGMMVEFTSAPDVAVGEEITVSGTTAVAGEYVKLTAADLVSKEVSAMPDPQNSSLAVLMETPKGYMYKFIQIEGLDIVSYDGNGYPTLTDGNNNIVAKVALNQSDFPAGKRINVKMTVAYDDNIILLGSADNVEAAPLAGVDTFNYPVHNDVYTLKNRWLISANLDNFSANRPGTADFVRAMVAKDGKMYFPDRENEQVVVIDGATGERLAPIKFASNVFRYIDADGETTVTPSPYPYNDLKLDAKGNFISSNLVTSVSTHFQVWKLDIETGEGTLLIDGPMNQHPDFAEVESLRFDAIGVYGDVDNDAIIMAANANAMEVYKWTITKGVVGEPELIEIMVDEEGTYLTGLLNPGAAPQVFPVDEFNFYLDGFATYPTLINVSGTDGIIIDGFYKNPDALIDRVTNPGSEWTMSMEFNGLCEFEIGNEYFLVTAATNNTATPGSTFRLFKFADGNKEFSDMEVMWTFPAAGMGGQSNSNQYRTAMPVVEVDQTTGLATIYVYIGENGYGVYEFQGVPGASGLNSANNNDVIAVSVKNNMVTLSEEVAEITVYSVTGQLLTEAKAVSSFNIPEHGVYILKATTYAGETAVHKVIVK